MKNFVISCILLFSGLPAFSSSQIEQLKKQLEEELDDTQRIDLLIELSNAYSTSNTDSAIYYCDIAINEALENGLPVQQINALRTKGNIFYRKGQYTRAIEIYKSSIPLIETVNQPVLLAKVYNNIGMACQIEGKIAEAEQNIKKALDIYIEANEEALQTDPLLNLGNIAFRQGSYNKAVSLYRLAFKIAEAHHLDQAMANILGNLGAVYLEWGLYNQSLENYKQSIALLQKLNNRDGEAVIYGNIGEVLRTMGNYSQAIDYISKALSIRREIKAEALIPSSLNKLGELYCDWGKEQLALDFFNQSIKLVETSNDKYNLATALAGMAQVYYNTELFDKALDLYNESANIFNEIDCKKELAQVYLNLGQMFSIYKVDLQKAVSYFSKAEQIVNQIGVKSLELDYCKQKADFLAQTGKITDAIALLNRSNKIFEGNKYILCENFQKLAEWYRRTGNNEKALDAYSKALQYQDSVWNEKNAFQSIKVQEEFNIRSQEREISALKEQNLLIAQKAERRSRFILMFVVFLTTIITLLSVLVVVNRRLIKANQKLNLQRIKIEKQNKEIVLTNSKLLENRSLDEEMNEFKRFFLYNIGREIKIPAGSILSMAKTIDERNQDPEISPIIHNLIESTDNLNYIISDLIDYSKIEEGKITFEKKPLNPLKIINSAILLVKSRINDKNLLVNIENNPSVPPVLIGDSNRLMQIVLNLLRNAIKFSEKNSTITLQIKGYMVDDHYQLRIVVIDEGIGIEEEKMAHIFESFSEANSEASRIYGGTGFGLGLVKRLVELQKGKIWVESQINKGSAFTFEIPFEIGSEIPEPPETVKIARIKKDIEKDHILILLAEDNLINQELTRDAIQQWGKNFEVDLADNGKIAIKKLEERDYDLVLMDIQMPEMDGHEATRYIREKMPQPYSDIPIIGITAHAINTEKEFALKNGMDDYITKPFNVDELKQKILYFVLKRNG